MSLRPEQEQYRYEEWRREQRERGVVLDMPASEWAAKVAKPRKSRRG